MVNGHQYKVNGLIFTLVTNPQRYFFNNKESFKHSTNDIKSTMMWNLFLTCTIQAPNRLQSNKLQIGLVITCLLPIKLYTHGRWP